MDGRNVWGRQRVARKQPGWHNKVNTAMYRVTEARGARLYQATGGGIWAIREWRGVELVRS